MPLDTKSSRLLGVLLMVGLAGWSWHTASVRSPRAEMVVSQPIAVPETLGFAPPQTITKGEVVVVHAASAVELPDGSMRACWFGGSREGGADVAIWTSRWDPATQIWGTPVVSLDRLWLEKATGLNIRKLGNPVLHCNAAGVVELFVVGVSMGGWSGGAIYHLRSADGGVSFDEPQRLISSPFMNISTLVKGAIMDTEDGGVIVPAYHEFVNKYALLVRLSAERKVTGIEALREGEELIQPWVINPPEGREIYFRNVSEPNLLHSFSDAGLKVESLPNPDSAVAALSVDGGTLLACNDLPYRSETSPVKRARLSIYFRPAGSEKWRRLRVVEGPGSSGSEEKKGSFSYPWLMQTGDGNVQLFYTWNRNQIRHVKFDAKDWGAP